MKLNVYAIYDTAVGAYALPFFMQSDPQALRRFGDLVMDADSEVSKHPEDYSLFRLANYNDGRGEFINEDNECLATALEMVAASRNVNKDQMELLQKEVNGNAPLHNAT